MIHIKSFKITLLLIVAFSISYIVIQTVTGVTNVKLISSIDLNIFSLMLSLVITAVVLLIIDGTGSKVLMFHLNLSREIVFFCLVLTLGCIAIAFTYTYIDLNHSAFEEWNMMPLFKIAFYITILLVALYAPGYIIHRTLLLKFTWNLIERIIFYPILSAIVIVLLKIVEAILRLDALHEGIFITLLIGTFLVLLKNHYHNRLYYYHTYINIKEIVALSAAAGFNLYVFYSAIGDGYAFLRGDMYGDAHRVAFLNKYGLSSYWVSPVEDYPPGYAIFWSGLLNILPIPYINGLMFIAFFNHLLSILSFYALARILLKDSEQALFAVILWTTLSGFSWTYLISNPPQQPLPKNELLEYISAVSQRFGVYSGSIVSHIYADGHALTRLWSLNLFFISSYALLKAYFDKRNCLENLIIFSLTLILIFTGHLTEVPLIALIIFLLTLIINKDSMFFKISFIVILITSVICLFLTLIVYGLNKIFMFISLTPLLAIICAKIFWYIFQQLSRKVTFLKSHISRIRRKVISSFSIVSFYLYILMLFAFLASYAHINWPIITLWFSPAIEWGFLGLLSAISIAWFGLKKTTLSFGFKFATSLFILQLFLLISLNYFNYNFFYITTPYPFQPNNFLPILALVASQVYQEFKLDSRVLSKARHYIHYYIILIIVLFSSIFSFGSLDHILSASYWKVNNGWWLGKPLNPSHEDYELINFLYRLPPASSYEFVGTFEDWEDPSSYVVYPSGMAVLSRPLIEILSQTKDPKDIYILTHTFPINYILVSKKNPLPPPYSLNFDGLDDYVEILDSHDLNLSTFTIAAWIKLNAYSSCHSPILDKTTHDSGYGLWIGGEKQYKGSLELVGGSEKIIPSNIIVEPRRWNFIAVAYNGTHATFYKNGIIDIKTVSWAFQNSSIPIRIGNERWACRESFNGEIGSIYLYNRALNPSEISSLYHNLLVVDGLALWLNFKEGNGSVAHDVSGNRHDGIIFGAKWDINSYLLSAISSIKPVFSNDKYEVFLFKELNISKTDLLPSSNDFLTTRKILYSGNISLIDNTNKTINIKNAKGEIFSVDKGKVLVIINRSNSMIVTTPFIKFEGNLTLIEMRATWGYFSEIRCESEEITIYGELSFKIFNTVRDRIYIESFSYSGTYKAFPPPAYLSSYYAKEQVKIYLQYNYVSPLKLIMTPFGIVWALSLTITLIIFLTRRAYT